MRSFLKYSLVILSLGVFVGMTKADRFHTFSTTCQYPVREIVVREVIRDVPIAIPVLVPAYQFQYFSPCATAVPVANMPVAGMQQATCGPNNVSVNDPERIRLLAKTLLLEMSKQQGNNNNVEDDGPPLAISEVGFQQFQQPQSIQQNFVNVLSNRCATCHTGPSAKGGVQIFSQPNQFNPYVDRLRVMRAIEDGRMPPQAVSDPSHRLTPQEIDLVKSGFSR